MFKLSRTALIFLVTGVLVIILAGLSMVYSQEIQEQSQLNEQLTLARFRLEKYPAQELASQKAELETRLAEAETELRLTKIGLYYSIQSIEASDALFDLAEASLVEVIKIDSTGVGDKQIGEVPLSALSLTVTVEGEVLNLVDFVFNWIKEYPTGIVESVEINVPEAVEGEEEKEPSAIINLLIYSYEYESE